MSWTATITDTSYTNGELVVTVLFCDGPVKQVDVRDNADKVIREKYQGDPSANQHEVVFRTMDPGDEGPTWLGSMIQDRFRRLKGLDALAASIAVGTVFEPKA